MSCRRGLWKLLGAAQTPPVVIIRPGNVSYRTRLTAAIGDHDQKLRKVNLFASITDAESAKHALVDGIQAVVARGGNQSDGEVVAFWELKGKVAAVWRKARADDA
jgi:hypothetical protein